MRTSTKKATPFRSLRVALTATVAAAAMVGAGLAVSPASAGLPLATVVSQIPANYTPDLAPDGVISHPAAYAVEQGGVGLMYVGGQFDAVRNGDGTGPVGPLITRQNFVAFSTATGAVSTTMAPSFNGNVWAIRYLAGYLYVGGEFDTVNGATGHRGIVKINASNGNIDTTFHQPWSSGKVYDLQVVGGRVIAGGTFAGALMALNATTGANLNYFNFSVSGTCIGNPACGQGGISGTNEPTHVYRFAVSPDGSQLVAIGNFVTPHPRAFMVDLGATSGTLDSWYYANLARACALPKKYPAYLRDVDFAPDSSYFVIAATGYVVSDPSRLGFDVCDAAAKFTVADKNPAKPVWINYTGGDTLHSVVVTTAAVYVQGHQRWLNNAGGRDSCNLAAGCVVRHGIGALDPTLGRALSWNPSKTRNVGGKDLLTTEQGLWVASDGQYIGKIQNNKYHYGIALMPL